MTDTIEVTAQTVGSVAAGVAITAEAIEDMADAVVVANRGAKRFLKLLLFLTVFGILLAVAAAAYKHLNDDAEDDFAY